MTILAKFADGMFRKINGLSWSESLQRPIVTAKDIASTAELLKYQDRLVDEGKISAKAADESMPPEQFANGLEFIRAKFIQDIRFAELSFMVVSRWPKSYKEFMEDDAVFIVPYGAIDWRRV